MTDETAWPRKGDTLFATADDWWHNACVGWSREQWIGYAEGYKLAADLLVQHVEDARSKQDFLVYPIVFLYRQSLEVAIKHVLVKGFQLLDRHEKLPTHHRLVPLWARCRSILEQVWPDGPKADLDAVSETIQQFDEKDPGSFTFRYAIDKAGSASLPRDEHINLRNLAAVMDRVYSLLDASVMGINDNQQSKCEMERDSAGY